MTNLILYICLVLSFVGYSQTREVPDSLIQFEISNLKKNLTNLQNEKKDQSKRMDALSAQIDSISKVLRTTRDELGLKTQETKNKINLVNDSLSDEITRNLLYWIMAFFATVLGTLWLFLIFRKKLIDGKTDIIDRLAKTKSSIEEVLVKEFIKQTELMDMQFKVQLEKEKSTVVVSKTLDVTDHSLALKLADEITLIERNISFMDPNTKGLKQLSRSAGRLKDNLAANGYEIVELLGKKFHPGIPVVVINSIPDESLSKGDEIITKIVKPIVNFNSKMIQAGQVEVSVG